MQRIRRTIFADLSKGRRAARFCRCCPRSLGNCFASSPAEWERTRLAAQPAPRCRRARPSHRLGGQGMRHPPVTPKQDYERRRRLLPWRAWYMTTRWRRLRAAQLRAEPMCHMCKQRGIDRPASVCNHVTRHQGNSDAFWSGPFNSLCKSCHDSDQQRIEGGNQPRSFATADGWPRDPGHPWFSADRGGRS
jgi:5-methylcytosine-specific restriction enzyme A